jgi:hypothetical protein
VLRGWLRETVLRVSHCGKTVVLAELAVSLKNVPFSEIPTYEH